jgi:hypothetical protein
LIDGHQTKRETPATIANLSEGNHHVTLKRADGSTVHKLQLYLSDGAAEALEIDTRRLPSVLDISSNPKDAIVWIGDLQRGSTPLTISSDLRPGRTKLRLELPGCLTHEERIKLKPATVHEVRVNMTCSGPN